MKRSDDIDGTIFHVESMLSGTPGSEHYLKGLVKITWGDMSGMLTVPEAKAHALRILEVATGAEQEQVLVRFFMSKLDMTLELAVAILRDFREMRG